MADVVRAALIQAQWAGDKDMMTKNAIRSVQQAAAEGAKVVCLQELFNGPYFCEVQDCRVVRLGGTGARRSHDQAVHGRGEGERHRARRPRLRSREYWRLLQHGCRHRRGRAVSRKAPEEPHSAGCRLLGEVLLPAREPRVSGVRHGGRSDWRVHLLRAPLPRGLAGLGLGGAKIVFNPSATSRGMSEHLWRLEQPAAAVANEYFVGTINRVGVEPLGTNEFYGQSYFVDPRGQLLGEVASDVDEAVVVRDLDLGLIDDVRRIWAFYRDRRPETYNQLCEA